MESAGRAEEARRWDPPPRFLGVRNYKHATTSSSARLQLLDNPRPDRPDQSLCWCQGPVTTMVVVRFDDVAKPSTNTSSPTGPGQATATTSLVWFDVCASEVSRTDLGTLCVTSDQAGTPPVSTGVSTPHPAQSWHRSTPCSPRLYFPHAPDARTLLVYQLLRAYAALVV